MYHGPRLNRPGTRARLPGHALPEINSTLELVLVLIGLACMVAGIIGLCVNYFTT